MPKDSESPRFLQFHEIYKKMDSGDWQLPNIQRDFVWSFAKQKALFESIMNELPIGCLLLWPIKNSRKIPHVDFQIDDTWEPINKKPSQLVLDGQQRLTSIFIQDFFARKDRSVWGKLGIDGRTYKILVARFSPGKKAGSRQMSLDWIAPSRIENEPVGDDYIEVPCLLKDSSRRASKFIEGLKYKKDRIAAQDFRRSLLETEVTVDYLPENSDLTDAIAAFTNVNNQGTKLGVVDLAAIRLFEASSKFKRDLRALVKEFEGGGYKSLSRSSIINSVLFNLMKTADPAKASKDIASGRVKLTRKRVEKAIVKVGKGYKRLRQFLEDELHFPNGDGLSTQVLMVAAQFFISRNKSRTSVDNPEVERLKHWFFVASICLPYTGGSTRKKVDEDMTMMSDSACTLDDLFKSMRDSIGYDPDTSLLSTRAFGDLDGKRVKPNNAFKHLLFLVAHYAGARDWFSLKEINQAGRRSSEVDWDLHHIFPKGCEEVTNGVEADQLESIGNLAWITKRTNRGRISNRLPRKYLREVWKIDEKLLETQAIPLDQKLWSVNKYGSFIESRIALLAKSVNRVLAAWKKGSSPKPYSVEILEEETAKSVMRKYKDKEDQRLEFKSTFSIDTKTGEKNWKIEQAAVRAVASMANAGGGYLVIGVEEVKGKGRIIGLEADLDYFENQKGHEIETVFKQAVNKRIKPKLEHPELQIKAEKIKGKTVLFVKVYPSSEEILMKYQVEDISGNRETVEKIWVRDGIATRSLSHSRNGAAR